MERHTPTDPVRLSVRELLARLAATEDALRSLPTENAHRRRECLRSQAEIIAALRSRPRTRPRHPAAAAERTATSRPQRLSARTPARRPTMPGRTTGPTTLEKAVRP